MSKKVFPLSYSQERLWFLDKLTSHNLTYNVPFGLWLEGKLDKNVLQTTLNYLVERHEALRTIIKEKDGIGYQEFLPPKLVMLDFFDVHDEHPEVVIDRAYQKIIKQPFDLAQGPLVRFGWITTEKNKGLLLGCMHHIITDGWSQDILIRDFAQAYAAYAKGKLPDLEPLTFQYADYAQWQREYLHSGILEMQNSYWKKQLTNIPILNLPTDYPRPKIFSQRGSRIGVNLDKVTVDYLSNLTKKYQVTLFMLLLAVLQLVLSRYSGQFDIAVGTPVANRRLKETEDIVGFFVNTLVLRGDLKNNPSFVVFLEQTKQMIFDAYKHQDIPFEQVVNLCVKERDTCYNPLFSVMLVLQNKPSKEIELPELKLLPYHTELQVAKFDMTLFLMETQEGLTGFIEYCTDLYRPETIRSFWTHFEKMLHTIIEAPQKRLSEFNMLLDTELSRIQLWNNTEKKYDKNKVLHQLFEEQVESTPNNCAIIFENSQLTYRELNNRANQLAHFLRDKGVGPEILVGICLERSLELVIAILGVLKAGGAYVPLDPNYSKERIEFTLVDANILLCLTEKNVLNWVKEEHNGLFISNWEVFAKLSTTNLAYYTLPKNPAYVIYTSGSTGVPKGVIVTHEGICNTIIQQTNCLNLDASQRIFQFANFTFDASVWEIFMTLTHGATLYLISTMKNQDINQIANFLNKNSITTVTFPPSLLLALSQVQLKSVRQIISAGETCSLSLLKLLATDYQLINAYGPTEDSICTTMHRCSANEEAVSISGTIGNKQLYVIDHLINMSPLTVPGELCISGVGLARGYLNRPDLTAERFIPNPFGPPGSRMYRTGDLVRWLDDGNIEYLGRTDFQVKLRGFRIECGEIESRILQVAGISQAVVISREDNYGNRLVAYLVGDESTKDTVIEHLKSTLPEYMIPSLIVFLESFPLNSNGKLNRKALPEPEYKAKEIYVAPRNEAEKQLCLIWQKVLNIERVGIDDNFFELGGDSILSLQIIYRASRLGLTLTPRQLFESQTIEKLAKISNKLAIIAEQTIVNGEVGMTPILSWAFERKYGDHFNQAVFLKTSDYLESKRIDGAIKIVINHHDALRMRFSKKKTGYEIHHGDLASSYQIKHYSLIDCEDIDEEIRRIVANAQLGLDIENGPITKICSISTVTDHYLLWIIHHYVVDGVSWRILLDDLFHVYEQLLYIEDIVLPLKSTSWQYWVNRLNDHVQSTSLQDELQYWLNLPAKSSWLPNKSFGLYKDSATVCSILLEEKHTHQLLRQVPRVYQTEINEILLATLLQALCDWQQKSDWLIDIEGHGREDLFEDIDISRTIGWFTCKYPVYFSLDPKTSLKECILGVKETLRHVPCHGIGFGLLRYLHPDISVREEVSARDNSCIIFNYLGQLDTALPMNWQISQYIVNEMISPDSSLGYALSINGQVMNGKLTFTILYATKCFEDANIALLMNTWKRRLTACIDHCANVVSANLIPSDFSLDTLHQSNTSPQFYIRFSKDNGQPKIFFIHGADGLGISGRKLALHLRDGYDVYAFIACEYANIYPRSVKERAVIYLDKIRELQPNGPYIIIGHSAGVHIAYEIEKLLECQNIFGSFIGFIDDFPSKQNRMVIDDEKSFFQFLLDTNKIEIPLEKIITSKETSRAERYRAVYDFFKNNAIQSHFPIPTEFNEFLRVGNIFITLIQHSTRWVTMGKINDCFLFIATDDKNIDLIQLVQEWQTFVVNRVIYALLPGNHISIISEPNKLQELAVTMKKFISKWRHDSEIF